MSPQKHINPEDLPLYAMQLLPPDQAVTIQDFLDQNPATRQEIAEIQGVLAAIAFASDMHSPAPAARARFLNAVAQEKRATPIRPVAAAQPVQAAEPLKPVQARPAEPANVIEIPVGPPASELPGFGAYQRSEARHEAEIVDFEQEATRRGFASRVLPWAGWAVAAGLALSTGNLYQKSENLKRSISTEHAQLTRTAADAATARDVMSAITDETAKRVTLTRQGALLTPTGRTVYSAEKGVLIFSATNMEPVQTFKVYELWIIPTGKDAKPIPAGTFRPDARGTANMVLTTLPKGIEAKAFGITIEEDGGSKTPTLPILMQGT